MRVFESNKWYTVTKPEDLPTEEEFGANRMMVQERDKNLHYAYNVDGTNENSYGKFVSRFILFDLPEEEPDVCPVCGKKDNFYHVEKYGEYQAGCHDFGDHEIYIIGADRADCIRKWNALPRGGSNG